MMVVVFFFLSEAVSCAHGLTNPMWKSVTATDQYNQKLLVEITHGIVQKGVYGKPDDQALRNSGPLSLS